MKELLGILGGMGPFASAEFLKTIYECHGGVIEQTLPACVLYSDPSIPNRTEAILSGNCEVILERLVQGLNALDQMGATKIVIACVTAHHFLPAVPENLRRKVISLIDVIAEEVLMSRRRHLLMCTTGASKAGVFQKHDEWRLIKSQVVLVEVEDQLMIQDLIHRNIKANRLDDSLLEHFDYLSGKYRVDSFIAGCTEIHLLVKRYMRSGRGAPKYQFVDPLMTLARDLKKFTNLVSIR